MADDLQRRESYDEDEECDEELNLLSDDEYADMIDRFTYDEGLELLQQFYARRACMTAQCLKVFFLIFVIQPDLSQLWMWFYLLLLLYSTWRAWRNSVFRMEWIQCRLVQMMLWLYAKDLLFLFHLNCISLSIFHNCFYVYSGWKRRWLFSYTMWDIMTKIESFAVVPKAIEAAQKKNAIPAKQSGEVDVPYQCNLFGTYPSPDT